MSPVEPQLIIITGGSEVTSLAIADAARKAAMPYAVFSLVKDSLLKAATGYTAWQDLFQFIDNPSRLRDQLLFSLAHISKNGSTRVAILPSEDGGLRLLNEYRNDILCYAEFSRARKLEMGGIDKAEVAEAINHLGKDNEVAPTLVLHDPGDAIDAFHAYGSDTVFKPALKPLNMDLSGMGSGGIKIVTQRSPSDTPDAIIQRLRIAWPMSRRWVAQPRLHSGPDIERSVCAVRSATLINATQVIERAKYPRVGGTALWVSTDDRTDLIPTAGRVLRALDVIGICEMSYLPDASSHPYMIELNPRPWLQTELVQQASFPIITDTVATLRGQPIQPAYPEKNRIQANWIQPERAVLAAVSLQLTARQLITISTLSRRKSTIFAGYSSNMPGVRAQLAKRAIRKAIDRY